MQVLKNTKHCKHNLMYSLELCKNAEQVSTSRLCKPRYCP